MDKKRLIAAAAAGVLLLGAIYCTYLLIVMIVQLV